MASTDQIDGLITEMNAILHNEFYLSLRHNKTCHSDVIWGVIQGLLCVETVSAAQNLVKITQQQPATNQHLWFYVFIAQSGLSASQMQSVLWVQSISQTLTQKMHVSHQNWPGFIKSGLQNPIKIVLMLNQIIIKFFSDWIEAVWALPSSDLILRVNNVEIQQDLHKQSGWTEALRTGIWVNQLWFTVLVKSIQLDVLDCSDQEMAQRTLAQQNLYLEKIELIHIYWEQARHTKTSAKVSTVLVDMASSQQTNLLIQKGLVLG